MTTTPRPTPDDRIAELVVRHHLGQYRDRPAVQRRLDELFEHNRPGTYDRLLRACDHLGVTGHELERLADLAVQRENAGADANATSQQPERTAA